MSRSLGLALGYLLDLAVGDPRRWHPVAKAVKSGAAELARNPRARSAVLRSAVRTGEAARPVDLKGLGVPQIRGAA